LIEETVLGHALDGPLLDNAVRFVCWVGETHGPDLAAAGGGRPAVRGHDEVDGPTDDAAPGTGPANVALPLRDVADLAATDAPCEAATVGASSVAVNAAGYL
jgi:hypothetical protein